MAEVSCPGAFQLLRGARKPQEPGGVSGSGRGAMVADSPPSEPETPDLVDAHLRLGSAMASATAHAPPLSRCSLYRLSSEIRTGCANQRSSGSVEGVVSNRDPYSDHQLRRFSELLARTDVLRPTLRTCLYVDKLSEDRMLIGSPLQMQKIYRCQGRHHGGSLQGKHIYSLSGSAWQPLHRKEGQYG